MPGESWRIKKPKWNCPAVGILNGHYRCEFDVGRRLGSLDGNLSSGLQDNELESYCRVAVDRRMNFSARKFICNAMFTPYQTGSQVM